MQKPTKSKWLKLLVPVLALALVLPYCTFFMGKASAGALTNTLVRFDRMKTSQATTGTVCAKAATAATETSVKVTFPTSYTVSSTVGNWTVSTGTTTGWPAGASAWPSISAPTGSGEFVISGQAVNFVSGDMTVGTLYCFNWTNTAALSIKSSATTNNTGTIITQTTGGSASDTGNYATSSIANDQIAVTATVTPSFSFSLLSNTAALGTLSSGGPSSATAISARVSTNASHGWQMWAADTAGTPGLTSTTASKTIAYSPTVGSTAAALSTNVEGYNLGVGTASGTVCTGVTSDTNFASGGTSFKGGGLDGTLRSLAAATGAADTCDLPLTVNASISNTTPAATDYAGTMNVVAAGNF